MRMILASRWHLLPRAHGPMRSRTPTGWRCRGATPTGTAWRANIRQPGTKGMTAKDFTADIEAVCPSERQNFRVSLIDYLSMQYPDAESGSHLSTANRAIELAQKDIVTAFVKHKATN